MIDFAERLRLIQDAGLTEHRMYPITLLGHRLYGYDYQSFDLVEHRGMGNILLQRYPH